MRVLFISLFATLFLGAPPPADAAAFDTAARNAIVVDVSTGTVIFEKNADVAIPPASMSKLMTVNMVFEALAEGRLSMDDTFPVSEKAWRMGGSKMFVKVGDRIRVGDLLRGVIIQSGNDACIVLAEGIAGSEAEFARSMTRRARELGMEQSTFVNATGWPAEDHRMSARDLAVLAERIIQDFPDYYALYSEQSFEWEGISQNNRNPLLRLDLGADGLKTGHTEEAGYGLVGSAEQDGRRLIAVIAGLDSVRARALEGERILRWGFRAFEMAKLLDAGAQVGEAEVWIGAAETVPLVIDAPVALTTRFGDTDRVTAELHYTGPVPAPIAKGDALGILRLAAPGMPPTEVPVYAGADVAEGGFMKRLTASTLKVLGDLIAPGDAPADTATSGEG